MCTSVDVSNIPDLLADATFRPSILRKDTTDQHNLYKTLLNHPNIEFQVEYGMVIYLCSYDFLVCKYTFLWVLKFANLIQVYQAQVRIISILFKGLGPYLKPLLYSAMITEISLLFSGRPNE